MAQTSTTSIRLDEHADKLLANGALRQLIRANQSDAEDEANSWEQAHDTRGWQSYGNRG